MEMSVVSGTDEPAAPGKVDTPEVVKNAQEDTPPRQPADDEEDVYEDADLKARKKKAEESMVDWEGMWPNW